MSDRAPRSVINEPAAGSHVKKSQTIEVVVKKGLCTGCGTCVAICPNSAIGMFKDDFKGLYVPKLDHEKCNKCGICYEVCPGHSVDFKQLNQAIFDKEPNNILIGNYLNCYIGHATDYDVRYNSASGGLVTALLVFALVEGVIDGALVTRMNKQKPLEPEPLDRPLISQAKNLPKEYFQAMDCIKFGLALDSIWSLINAANKYIEDAKPWDLSKQKKSARVATVVYNLAEVLRIAAILIYPFIPGTSLKMLKQLGLKIDLDKIHFQDLLRWGGVPSGTKINKGQPLFPRIV